MARTYTAEEVAAMIKEAKIDAMRKVLFLIDKQGLDNIEALKKVIEISCKIAERADTREEAGEILDKLKKDAIKDIIKGL